MFKAGLSKTKYVKLRTKSTNYNLTSKKCLALINSDAAKLLKKKPWFLI